MKIRQGMCKGNCGLVKVIKDDNSIGTGAHLAHLVMSILTGFIWAIIWILHANLRGEKWHCSQCGSIAK